MFGFKPLEERKGGGGGVHGANTCVCVCARARRVSRPNFGCYPELPRQKREGGKAQTVALPGHGQKGVFGSTAGVLALSRGPVALGAPRRRGG